MNERRAIDMIFIVSQNVRVLLLLAAAIALVKLLELTIDRTPLFYYDSGAYIANAFAGMSPGRSKTYGLLIRAICLPFHPFTPMVVLQSLMGGVIAWLLAFVLIRFFNVRPWIASLAALIFALDPVQIVSEHLILGETSALFVTALFLTTALFYLCDHSPKWLVLLAFLGTVLISVKIVYLPLVIACAIALPIVSKSRVALLISLSATLIFHVGYRAMVAHWTQSAPAYQKGSGFFLAARVVPLLEPQADLLNYEDFQLWNADGIVKKLIRAYDGDYFAADHAAGALARRAILHNPAGYVNLIRATYFGLWDSCLHYKDRLPDDDGFQPDPQLTAEQINLISAHFGADSITSSALATPSRRYHLAAGWWNFFLLVSPFLGVLAVWSNRSASLFAAWALILLAANCAGVATPSLRYLQPLSFTGLAAVAILLEATRRTDS